MGINEENSIRRFKDAHDLPDPVRVQGGRRRLDARASIAIKRAARVSNGDRRSSANVDDSSQLEAAEYLAGYTPTIQPSLTPTERQFEIEVAVDRMHSIKVRPRVALARIGGIQQRINVVLKFLRRIREDSLERVVDRKREAT